MGLVKSKCEKGKGLVSNHTEGKTEKNSSGEQEGICMGRNTNSLVICCLQSEAGNHQGPPECIQLTAGMKSAHLPAPQCTHTSADSVSRGLSLSWPQ